MKENMKNKISYIGAGTGIALFAVFGLLPGAYLGGILGLNMANSVFGTDVMPALIHRVLTAVGMLTGVMVAGLMFVVSGACLGWLIGLAAEAAMKTRKEHVAEKVNKA